MQKQTAECGLNHLLSPDMVTVICDFKHIRHRLGPYLQTRLASVITMFNVVLTLFHRLHPDADPSQMSIAEFSL